MDPYVYPNTSVLINKLGITDEQQLITVEAQLIIANLLEIESLISKVIILYNKSIDIYSTNYMNGPAIFAQSISIKMSEFWAVYL